MNKTHIYWIFIIILTVCMIYMAIQISELEKEILSFKNTQAHIKITDHQEEIDEPEELFEVADVMNKLQRYFNKLWFAGKSENWKLANFYHHEMDEAFEELQEANVIENGQNLSNLSKVMADPGMDELKIAIESNSLDAFGESYIIMMNGCNSCHLVAKHPYIKIIPPTSPAYSNQEYGE